MTILATNSTANQQRTELFVIAKTLLAAGASVNSDTRRGRGFNSVQVLARANAAATGRVRIFQSVDGGTNWILTDEETSQVDAVSGESVIFISASIFGEDVRVQFTNTSGGTQTAFDIQAYLIPHGGAGGGGGGGGGGFGADTRNADANDDFAAALIGLVTNSRTAYLNRNSGIWELTPGETDDGLVLPLFGHPTNIGLCHFYVGDGPLAGTWTRIHGNVDDGTLPSDATRPTNISILYGRNNSGVPTVASGIEARALVGNGDLASSLIGLLCNARLGGFNSDSGNFSILNSIRETSATDILLEIPARQDGYVGMTRNRRFSFTHQTPGTLITAQAAFVATTPTLLLRNAAGNTTTVILRTVRIDILEATVAPVLVTIAIDTADRLSAGGTAIVGQNWNESSASAYPGTNFLFNATASAAGAGTRYLMTLAIPAGIGQSITINFKDGVQIVGTGSILVYVYDSAGVNAPDIVETVEVEAF